MNETPQEKNAHGSRDKSVLTEATDAGHTLCMIKDGNDSQGGFDRYAKRAFSGGGINNKQRSVRRTARTFVWEKREDL